MAVTSWQLEDLLKDELAGDQPIGAWEFALQSMFLRTDRANFSQFRLRRLHDDAILALANLQKIMAQAEQLGFLRKADPDGELIKFTAGLSAAVEALTSSSGGANDVKEVRAGIVEAVDEEVYQHQLRQDRFYSQADEQCKRLDGEARDHLAGAFISLEKGLSQRGEDRASLIREARYESNLANAMLAGEHWSLAPLVGAITEWKLTRSAYEAEKILRRSWPMTLRDHDLMTHLSGRMFAHLLLLEEDRAGAWEPLLESAEVENDSDVILEAFQLAVKLNKWEQARRLAEKGAEVSPLFLIRLLASHEAGAMAGDVLTLVVARQQSMRNEIRAELTHWQNEIRRIRQARKALDIELEFVATMEAIRKDLASKVNAVDLISALSLKHSAVSFRSETMRMATDRFKYEHGTAVDDLEMAKTGIDQAWAQRDAMVDAAVKTQRVEADRAREALRSSLAESEKNHAGCVLGFGSGCGAFLLYLMIAAFLATQGVEAGFGTVFGWFGLAATGVPILFTVAMQVTYGFQRVALDAALHEKIKATEAAYEAAVKRADQFYREKVLDLRGNLTEIEARVKKSSEALQILNASG